MATVASTATITPSEPIQTPPRRGRPRKGTIIEPTPTKAVSPVAEMVSDDGPKSAPTAPEPDEPQLGIGIVLEENSIASGFMTPEGMEELLFISRFEDKDPWSTAPDKHGFQRALTESRVPGIARYYLNQHPPRIPALDLAVRVKNTADIAKFLRLFGLGDKQGIIKQFGRHCISVIDGQHRSMAVREAHRQNAEFNPRVPVTLNFGMSFVEEAENFDVRNTTQKRLPPALLEVTKADITEVGTESHQQRLRNITKHLSRNHKSVWHGLISESGDRGGGTVISFNGMRRALASMFPVELLSRLDAKELDPSVIATDYWKLVAEVCTDAWNNEPKVKENEEGEEELTQVGYRIKEVSGVSALCKLGKDIVSSALEHDNFDQKMGALVGKLSEVDWEKSLDNPWMARSQAGMAGQAAMYQLLFEWVYADKRPGRE